MRSARQTARTLECPGCFASLRSEQGAAPLAASPIPAYLSFGNGFDKPFPNGKSENRIPYIDRLPIFGRRSFMCPIRPLDEHGRWGNKQRRKYLLDEYGQCIQDEAGNYPADSAPAG